MTAASPTLGQIKALVNNVRQNNERKHAHRSQVIGIQSPGRWTGGAVAADDGLSLAIRQCDSPLAMRLALREPVPEGTTKVLITPLEQQSLSDDILVRLAKRRLLPLKTWEIVQNQFQARAVDPRVSRHRWIADVLLEHTPADGYPAVRGGFLDAETVWPVLLLQTVGLKADPPDLTSLLKWSRDAVGTEQYRQSFEEFRQAAQEWLSETAGSGAGLVLRCIAHLDRPDAISIGLAAGVVFHPRLAGQLERAAAKFEERYLGGESPNPEDVLRWSAAATELTRGLKHTEPKAYRPLLQRADEILAEVGADLHAEFSDTSLLGFERRLRRFGEALVTAVARPNIGALQELQAARDAAQTSDLASSDPRRMERVDCALRLARWLVRRSGTGSPQPRSLAEAATDYLREGGYVDWARLRLRTGDPDRGLSDAYAKLFAAVTLIQEQGAQQFGQLLVDWNAAGAKGTDLIPVEQILEQVVAPLAAERPVLLVVIDGMSVAVSRELLADLIHHDWLPVAEPGRTSIRAALATIPSVTESSRTSLLCGKLMQGGQAEEQAGFMTHHALLAHCRSNSPPVLYHKVSLQELGEAGLPGEVRRAIESTHRRVVGVVVNAVDDHLAKGEQLDTRWSRDEIKVLPALLHEARAAGRLVVLISDHGHVLDCITDYRPAEGGSRWRASDGEPAADELRIAGSRVLVEGRQLIASWSESPRYGGKQNGYHGGLSPQEMVVPILILSPSNQLPDGWQLQPVDTPEWWDSTPQPLVIEPPVVWPVPRPQSKGKLFDLDAEAGPGEVPATGSAPVTAWVGQLLACEVYQQQRQLAGRNVPADEQVGRLLGELDRRGGKLTSVALARVLGCPAFRLPGLVARVQRLVNIDGYTVLNRDDASETIELNRELLLTQFDLGALR